ncbi:MULTISPECIES: site-specific integrase [Sphingobacterium]|uniref:Tyrosine-type recombinase/integrase n=1 Tax=Sphingobacterium populi TaxID=1812824 RepID=A0ABW5U841_9SPHI|nr:site-specific integrase [Sphingobacterium sp. CFCC 11742]
MNDQNNDVKFYVALDSKKKANGTQKVFLRLYQKGKKIDFFTGIVWTAEYFDKSNERLKPRFSDDPDVHPHNMTIGQYKSLVHKIIINAYVNDLSISIDDIVTNLKSLDSNTDFLMFCRELGLKNVRSGIITYETFQRHRVSFNKLIEFWNSDIIPIDEITTNKIEALDAYFRKLYKAHNTISGYHKDIKGYLNKAVKAGLIKTNPYDHFRPVRYIQGDREVLTQDELKRLMDVFRSGNLLPEEHEVLRRFLFSCLTGIRISDTHSLRSDQIKNGFLLINPHKGRKYGKKIKLPISLTAQSLIANREGIIFTKSSDQQINRMLKVIAAHAKIYKRISYHCARDTFGTIFIERGGDVKSLCDLMGHSDIRITMIYLKMSDQRKVQLMNNFDDIFD